MFSSIKTNKVKVKVISTARRKFAILVRWKLTIVRIRRPLKQSNKSMIIYLQYEYKNITMESK